MSERAVANPFVSEQSQQLKPSSASTDVAVQRELAEVQAAVLMARRFPRDPVQAMDAILRACTRATLAEGALYTYVRGKTEITGPSIRLAEAMAQCWQNLAFGIRELEQRHGESTMEAYCWDLETNVRQSRVFQVRHERYSDGRTRPLIDPRDIYEQNANQGARRLRACILGVIPGDVVEAAQRQCEETLHAEADTSPEGIRKVVDSFAQIGVTREQLEARCQRRIETIRPAQVIQLRKIWQSLNDGMSSPEDWFKTPQQQEGSTGNEALRARLRRQASTEARDEQTAAAAPSPTETETPHQAATASDPGLAPIPEIRPRRLRAGGWDWTRYVDDMHFAIIHLAPEQIPEFLAKNDSMINALRTSAPELYETLAPKLYERPSEEG